MEWGSFEKVVDMSSDEWIILSVVGGVVDDGLVFLVDIVNLFQNARVE